MNTLSRFALLVSALLVATSTTTSAFAPSSMNKQHHTLFVGTVPDENDMGLMGEEPTAKNAANLAPLALKMAGVLAVKTAKDVVNYPPMMFDKLTRSSSGKDETNPFTMLAKLMGVLVFKTVHDAVYFPMIWSQRMIQCQSLDECDVDSY